MSTSQSISRRTALAGLGTGSLGLAFLPHIATAKNQSPATSVGDHPLTGLWLAHVGLPSDRETVVAVPTFFGTDGSAFLAFPCIEAGENGVQLKGTAVGTWRPIDDRYGRFTTVQVVSDLDGTYAGSITLDSYVTVSENGQTFSVDSHFDLMTIRDGTNKIIRSTSGPFANPMQGIRMQPGNPGFPSGTD